MPKMTGIEESEVLKELKEKCLCIATTIN